MTDAIDVAAHPVAHQSSWPSRLFGEIAKKPLEAVAALITVVAAIAATMLQLMISRYLSVYGQPGLSGFGQVISILPSLVPVLAATILVIVVLIAITFGSPFFARLLFSSTQDTTHPLAQGFFWPKDEATPRGPHLEAYVVAYAPLIVFTLILILAMISGATPPLGRMALACAAALTVPIAWSMYTAPPGWKSRRGAGGLALFFSAMLNVMAVIWLTLAVDFVTLNARGLFEVDDETLSLAVVLLLVGFHLFMTAHGREGVVVIMISLLIVGLVVFRAPGDQLLTFHALRFAGVGGGGVTIYRQPGEETVRTACLILATDTVRIVRKTEDPADCTLAKMRDEFIQLRDAEPTERVALLQAVRVYKRDDLLDALPKPAAKPVP